ncbi:MAG TPA: hypothetical protein VHE14_08080, partial [Solirubrobacteraceae bacterium]|nr:hypothetical protein [Solirubrobacteraceae bacterium]
MAELRQSAEPAAQAAPIHPDSALGAVTLTVADLERVRAFYEQVIGLRTLDRSRDRARLGTATTL